VSLKVERENKFMLIAKLLIYSSLYGLIMINYIDLIQRGVPGYHLWLVIMYFAPFIPILFLLGFDDWELVVALGLLASLMNDLFYYPVGRILLGRTVDLINWYKFQLGLQGFKPAWTFQGGIFTFRVTSILMGTSIYARILATIALCWKWLREGENI